jgi:hypothetical protein
MAHTPSMAVATPQHGLVGSGECSHLETIFTYCLEGVQMRLHQRPVWGEGCVLWHPTIREQKYGGARWVGLLVAPWTGGCRENPKPLVTDPASPGGVTSGHRLGRDCWQTLERGGLPALAVVPVVENIPQPALGCSAAIRTLHALLPEMGMGVVAAVECTT